LFVLLAVWSLASTAQDTAQDTTDVFVQVQTSQVKENYRENHFRFVYIDHEEKTPVAILHQRLEQLHKDAVESGNYLIVYLADEDEPIISFTNLTDPNPEGGRDKEDAFNYLIKQIYRTTHEVKASADLDSLKRLFGTDGIFPLFDEQDEQVTMNFKSVALDFYVGPHFWNLRCNEDLIAQLFVSLKMDKRLNTSSFPPTKLSFNVLKPRGVQLMYPSGMPFGRKDPGKINSKIIIKDFY